MAYEMGETPLILQGAAAREKLTPEQLDRLKMQGIQTVAASVNITPVLLPLGVGMLAAWFLAGGAHRRTLW